MAKSFSNPTDVQQIKNRLAQLTPATERQWGSMSAHQVICHLSESFLAPLGDRKVESMKRPLPAFALRFIFLSLPIKWTHGPKAAALGAVATDADAVAEFDADRKNLIQLFDRLIAMDDKSVCPPNPFFGAMNESQWKRWAWLHTDHHLRQFGL